MQEKKDNQNFEENKDSTIKVNVIEEGQSSKSQGSKRSQQLKSQSKNNKKKKKGKCFYCKKKGHYKSECKILQNKKEKQDSCNNTSKNLVTIISKVNLIKDDFAWYVDSSAMRHICNKKEFFKSMKPAMKAPWYT